MSFSKFTLMGFASGLFFGGLCLIAERHEAAAVLIGFAVLCYVAQLGRNRLRERRGG